MKCEWCNSEVDELEKVYMDGMEDLYVLNVCEKCSDEICGEYYPPEQVDEFFK